MKEFRVDLHLHTCLSPCGSLEMSPQRIVETALERGVDAIAVTDHNSTLQCPEIQALGEERGLMVFAGAEVTTREEAHCVALFADDRARAAFCLSRPSTGVWNRLPQWCIVWAGCSLRPMSNVLRSA